MELPQFLVGFLQALAAGVTVGGAYALMCIGLGIIFGSMRVINFAQGDFLMLGMYVAFYLTTGYGILSLLGPYGGPIIAAFVVFHLLHLTIGTIHPKFVELHAYENLVTGFLVIPFALVYIVVMILIGFHLSHGVWSMFQSMGMSHPRYTPLIKRFASIFSWILVAGFISIPIAVLTGVVR